MKSYYHITPYSKKTHLSILANGLNCDNEGHIFLFENVSLKIGSVKNDVCDMIAANQLGIKKYLMYEIAPEGIETELIPDNVGELSAKHQWIAKQPTIKPEHINLFGIFKTNYNPFIVADFTATIT